eukprot:TRINITY_DN10928_c0_g1_i1.p1 TRINITY_DN10928_c0_g1~~TRINITY_DN10928_c0_g1_i1.p1  ORF type:complete len:159 (+),score=27.93 TRINITY_DN10928_c0_g1_i1:66-542(+)
MSSDSAGVIYELCVRNTFIHVQPVATHHLRRSKSASAAEVKEENARHLSTFMHTQEVGEKSSATGPELNNMSVKMFIGNVPFHVTAERMEAELCMLGFKGTYAAVNFPLKSPGMTRGYGFVVFHDEGDATCFASAFSDYRFKDTSSKKKCYVKYARGN